MRFAVDLSFHLETVIDASLRIFREHETESQVLLVGKVLGVEDELAVKFAGALIGLAVSLEELELHGVASRVVECALCDHVVDLDVSSVGSLLDTAIGVADKAGKGESWKLSDNF